MHPNQPTRLTIGAAVGSLLLVSIATGIISTATHHANLPTINTNSKQQILGSSTTNSTTTPTPSSTPSDAATAHVTSSTPTAIPTTHSNSTATTSTTPSTNTTSTNTQPSTQTAPANKTPNSPASPSNNQTLTVTGPYVVSRTSDSVWVPDQSAGDGYWDAQCSMTWSNGKTITWNVGPPEKSEMGTLSPPVGSSICTSPQLQSPQPQ